MGGMQVFKKSFLLIVFSLAFLFVVSSVPTFANENDLSAPLTEEEINQLIEDVGMSEDIIDSFSNELLREVLESEATVINETTEIVKINEPEIIGGIRIIRPMQGGDLNEKKVKITGVALKRGIKTSGTWKGYREIHFIGGFEWLTAPVNFFTDGLAVGWGNSGIIVPTSNGKVDAFKGRYYRWGTNKAWNLYSSTSTPSSFDPKGGVGFKIDLRGGLMLHKGEISQLAYSRLASVDTNVKFSYGHKQFVGFGVSFGKDSGTFSVTPRANIVTGWAADTLRW